MVEIGISQVLAIVSLIALVLMPTSEKSPQAIYLIDNYTILIIPSMNRDSISRAMKQFSFSSFDDAVLHSLPSNNTV